MDILFCGASGFGNIGDDAYRHIFSEYLSPSHNIYFDSPYPDLDLVDQMDYIVIGGGGVIYDNGSDHFKYMTMYLDRAKQNGTPFSFSACGIQFTFGNYVKDQTPKMVNEIKRWKPYLEQADVVTLRSQRSVEVLKELSSSINAYYYPDLCYLIRPVDYHLIKPGSIVIVPTSQTFKSDPYSRKIASFDNYGKNRYVVTTSRVDEETAIKWAKNNIPGGDRGHLRYRIGLTPREAAGVFRDADHVLTTRYHGHVLARAAGKHGKDITILGKQYKNQVEKPPDHLRDAEGHIKELQRYLN